MQDRKISIIGLGYVGLPVAVAFGKSHKVIGFDINKNRIQELRSNHDRTLEVESAELEGADILYTSNIEDLKQADFHIVAVPTPIDDSKKPDLSPLLSASKTVGEALKPGDIVVYESTVYPGAVEEDCAPILEKVSGLKSGKDFFLGYSPERINPGDKKHTFTTIKKVVSGQNDEVLDIVAQVYASVVTAGIYKAKSIKVAEAAKVIENTQRDLNISLMNELAVIFSRLGIDTQDVLDAAGTKWNFLPFKPGLVGGHCIGVDPYYLTHKAQKVGYHPQVILSGRRINDDMGRFVVEQVVKSLILKGNVVKGATIAIMGLTFKEDCPDLRNSRVVDVIEEFESYGVNLLVNDPMADRQEAYEEYQVELVDLQALKQLDAIVLTVAHSEYKQLSAEHFKEILKPDGLVFDVKSVLDRDLFEQTGLDLYRL